MHGYFSVLREYPFRLIAASIRKRDLAAFALALDLVVPPLSVLVLAAGASLSASVVWALLSGAIGPLIASVLMNLGLALFLTIAWVQCGRDLIGWREFASLPRYVGSIARMVCTYLSGRRSAWLRAERVK